MRLLSVLFIVLAFSVTAQVPRASVGELLKHLTEKYGDSISAPNADYATLYLLHKMLTVDGPSPYNKEGGILGIPYVANYGKVNTRTEITKGGIPIATVEYPPYKSFADADRTPVLFYSDMVDTVPYNHPSCGDFYTFGWCSEREMAFASASYALGYKPRIVVQGNHTFTLVQVGRTIYQVDNTFGQFKIWPNIMPSSTSRLETWYNNKARVQSQQLWNVPVTDASWQRIENQLIQYLWPQTPLGSR